MKRAAMSIAVIVYAALVVSAVGACGAEPEAWVAYPDNGLVLACSFSARDLSEPRVIAADGAASFAPAMTIGPCGMPSAAWLNRGGDILYSGFDGSNWSPPELAALSAGRHRGIPSLAVGDSAVIAWAESERGMFEDIFYAVRIGERWGEPCRAHEWNDVPDILPSVIAGPHGAFSIRWKSFDGLKYIERHAGVLIPPPERGEPPPGLLEYLREARVPIEAALAWRGADGFPRSVYLKQLLDEGMRIAAREDRVRGLDEQTPMPAAAADAITSGTQIETHSDPTFTPTETAVAAAFTPTETPVAPVFTPTEMPVENTAVPGERHIDIIAFGDSLTYGRGSSSNSPRTAYPVILQTILNYNYAPNTFSLINKGLAGEETWEGLARIDSVLDSYRADAILIMEGTNDMFFQISFETVQENLKQMALRARRRGVFPVLATLIPTVPTLRPVQYQTTRDFYTGGYVQALSRIYHIPYADQWNAFCGIPSFGEVLMDWATTGNHPNDNGYRYVMAPEWYETIAPYIPLPFNPSPPKIVLSESGQSVTRGAVENFSYTLVPSNDMIRNAVDCYVALARPDGNLFFFNSALQLTKQITPVRRRLLLTTVPNSGALLELPIGRSDPLGVYTLYLATVRSLRDPRVAGNRTGFASASFEVR